MEGGQGHGDDNVDAAALLGHFANGFFVGVVAMLAMGILLPEQDHSYLM